MLTKVLNGRRRGERRRYLKETKKRLSPTEDCDWQLRVIIKDWILSLLSIFFLLSDPFGLVCDLHSPAAAPSAP